MTTQTHISYETARKLYGFLGESAPMSIGNKWWVYLPGMVEVCILNCPIKPTADDCPVYQLHDLLSKPFCEAMASQIFLRKSTGGPVWTEMVFNPLCEAYLKGGLPAVEASLILMMDGNKGA